MNTAEKEACRDIGPGGFKCPCCGPSPKNRPKWRRLMRRRLVAITRKTISTEIIDLKEAQETTE